MPDSDHMADHHSQTQSVSGLGVPLRILLLAPSQLSYQIHSSSRSGTTSSSLADDASSYQTTLHVPLQTWGQAASFFPCMCPNAPYRTLIAGRVIHALESIVAGRHCPETTCELLQIHDMIFQQGTSKPR